MEPLLKSRMQKTIHRKRTLIVFFILSALVIGCQKEQPPIKIGFVANLTGQTTSLAIGARNGVLMAVDDINASGGIRGRKIELIVKDDRFDPQAARNAVLALIQEDVAAIIGHIQSQMTIAGLPVANQARIVMLSPISASIKLAGIDDYFFRIMPPSKDSSVETARYAYRIGLRKMTGLYDLANKSYAEGKFLDFKDEFETLGGQMLFSQTFSSGADISFPDLARNLAREADGYFLVASPRDCAMICQHLRKIDPIRPILVSGWAYDPVFLQNGGAAVEGVVCSNAFQMQSREPAFLKFKEDYLQRYKTNPWLWETCGYEAVLVLSQALSHNPDPARLKTTLLEMQRFKGLQGDILFDNYGDSHRRSLIYRVENGAFVEIK